MKKLNKHSSSGIFLMEITISILFFSLCAVVCIELFVKAHTLSKSTDELTFATNIASNYAECFLNAKGDMSRVDILADMKEADKNCYEIYFDKNFNIIKKKEASYVLYLEKSQDEYDIGKMAKASITIKNIFEDSEVYSLSVQKYIPETIN
ncbi:hypothetical protein SAMN05216249_10780 [Acetitomaculum ruminis DSM 5522]|uniref:Prepilin-type N-terminal cleavage/methylation domain-containing protein n=1 Tax=Acetitomaculum ruminis DSM 5522 TaxID=1120918 RepID=A0A1I0XSF6_9FIRM|nr:hypothetical protein [Acetitomaculum ruminis]SFB03190.1 hypothetical protein SAMN05216249_10780 [Acetitomaculum ruminis DSM 5522]